MFDVSLSVSAPWYIHYRKLQAMFREDPQVTVKFDQDNYEVKLYVDDADKADALQPFCCKCLPEAWPYCVQRQGESAYKVLSPVPRYTMSVPGRHPSDQR
jgi:hypothetical protein